MYEHVFVRAKGSPYAHFQRAIERRHLLSAETAARELPTLSIADALALCLLLAEQDPERFDRVGARWHGRFVLEARAISLFESQLALAAVAALPRCDPNAVNAIRELSRRYTVPNVEAALRHFR